MERIRFDQLELNPFSTIGEDNFLITAGTKEKWNTMTAGWGGFGFVWNRPSVFIFVRESRYTLEFLDKYDSFSLSFFENSEDSLRILKEAGMKSGRNYSKMSELGLDPVVLDDTICFKQANMSITCKKALKTLLSGDTFIDRGALSHYPQGDWHYLFIGEIDGIYVN